MRVFFRFFVGDRHLQSEGRLRVNELWLAILLSLFFLPSILYSQWIQDPSIDQLMQKGIANVYNLEYSSADKFFSEVVKRKPDHPAGYFFKAMVVWLQILNNFEDESHDDKFYDMLDGVIDMCDERLDMYPNDVTALFFKGGAIGFRGRLRANRGKWLGAAKDGIQALPIVRKAYELEPNNYDVLLGIGIYNYYA